MLKEIKMSDEILELLEGVSSANNAFIKSEIALNNGEVEDSQKYSKEGQILLRSMINDTFDEVVEELEIQSNETLEYDYPCTMELIRALNTILMNASMYLSSSDDKNITEILSLKIITAINTAKEIFNSLYEN